MTLHSPIALSTTHMVLYVCYVEDEPNLMQLKQEQPSFHGYREYAARFVVALHFNNIPGFVCFTFELLPLLRARVPFNQVVAFGTRSTGFVNGFESVAHGFGYAPGFRKHPLPLLAPGDPRGSRFFLAET